MHLSVDSLLSLDALRAALPPALASVGLAVARVEDLPARGFVVELEDPLPAVDADALGGSAAAATWKVAAYARAEGGSRMSTLRPTHLVDLMDRPGAAGPATALEHALERALLAAAGRTEGGVP